MMADRPCVAGWPRSGCRDARHGLGAGAAVAGRAFAHLARALPRTRLASAQRDLDRRSFTGEDGRLRLSYPNPGWRQLLDLSLTEIRLYGAGSPQIARRMRALLLRLMEHTPEVRHDALSEQLARLDRAVAAAYSDPFERAHAEVPDHIGIGGAGAVSRPGAR